MDYAYLALQLANNALIFANTLMEKMPDYDQRKREKLFKIKQELDQEMAKPYGLGENSRDEAKVYNLQCELNNFIVIFNEELKIGN